MKISLNYLKKIVDYPVDTERLINDLTMNGLEVEAITKPYKDIDPNIKVVDIISFEPHPSNKDLSVVIIDCGGERHTVVCGARNVKGGMQAVWAPPHSRVQNFEIKEKDFKGVRSSGMLLSLEEIGLEEKSEGIWLFTSSYKSGKSLIDILDASTTVIDINVTPNRGDTLSYIGIAREVSAYYNTRLNLPPSDIEWQNETSPIEIEVKNNTACPLYQGTFAEGISVCESDIEIQKILIESGLRPINNIVDLSNFIMLETGHPNHTFDFTTLKRHKIIVRDALDGERIRLLNGIEITLKRENLLICDAETPIALAGVMGGEFSSITEGTSSILLECAIFSPDAIRLTTSMHNINSDSSYRFARGVNFDTVEYATRRFMHLLKKYRPDVRVLKPMTIANEGSNQKRQIRLRYSRLDTFLNSQIDRNFIKNTLTNLGFSIERESTDGLDIRIPSHRYDVSMEEDIIEEIARIYGYNRFDSKLPHTEILEPRANTYDRFKRQIHNLLSNLGLYETINYTFLDDGINSVFSEKKPITIKNPIAQDMSFMRKSILASLFKSAQLNLNRQHKDIRFFETGKIFYDDNEIIEEERLGILLSGKPFDRIWANPQTEYDFYDLKGILESLLSSLHIDTVKFKREGLPQYLHKGKSATIFIDNEFCGIMGEAHPNLLNRLDIKQSCFIAELNLDIIYKAFLKNQPVFRSYSPFPFIDRDIAIVINRDIPSEDVVSEIKEMNIPIVEDIKIFDLYEGKGIEEGKKSLGVAIRYRSTKSTLTDEEVEGLHSKIIDNLLKKFYGRLR